MHSHMKPTTDGSKLDNAFEKIAIALIFVVCGLCSGNGMTQELTVLSSKPVQVHRFGPIRDHHPERENAYRDSRVSSAKPGPENAIQATESPLMLAPPLRSGRSSTAGIAFSISNYVDHNEAFPDQLSDWECGDRTYDTETFNHNGTDYQSTQFPWLTMANDGLITVAAADGIIVNKHDGEPDQRCIPCTLSVALLHIVVRPGAVPLDQ